MVFRRCSYDQNKIRIDNFLYHFIIEYDCGVIPSFCSLAIRKAGLSQFITACLSQKNICNDQSLCVLKDGNYFLIVSSIVPFVNLSNSDDKTSFGALTQRLVSCLIEENLLNGGSFDSKNSSNETFDLKTINGSPNHKVFKSLNLGNTAQLERRIRKELEEHGIISLDDILNATDDSTGDDDEILDELKRCQHELKALASKNQSHLKKLLALAKKEMTRQEIKRKLEAADTEVIEAYRRICCAKQKKRSPTKKEREFARKALKERDLIVRQLESLY